MSTSTPTSRRPAHRGGLSPQMLVALAAVIDVSMVVAFVAIGRRSHDEGGALRQIITTAAPFLVGLACGWVATRAWRRPLNLVTGLGVWVTTLVVGMLIRRFVAHDGTALAFVIVATIFLGVTLVGWRAIAHLSGLGGRHAA